MADDLRLSKYLAVRIMPGVVDKPTPIPVKMPRKTKRNSILGARLLREIPRNEMIDPANERKPYEA